MLEIPERDIGLRGPGNALLTYWRHWRAERSLARRGLRFRSTGPEAIAAYAAMTIQEFEAINGLQIWANWRTIPRCLSGRVPNRPLRIIDLGCGCGSSTQALAWYAPAGSHITGYEFVELLVAMARSRQYPHASNQPARVDFVCQNLTEPLQDGPGWVLAPGTVDVVNASGVIGHHFNAESAQPLIAQLQVLLRPAGIAMLDVGPTLGAPALTNLLQSVGFRKLTHCRSWLFDRTGQIVFLFGGHEHVTRCFNP